MLGKILHCVKSCGKSKRIWSQERSRVTDLKRIWKTTLTWSEHSVIWSQFVWSLLSEMPMNSMMKNDVCSKISLNSCTVAPFLGCHSTSASNISPPLLKFGSYLIVFWPIFWRRGPNPGHTLIVKWLEKGKIRAIVGRDWRCEEYYDLKTKCWSCWMELCWCVW